MTSHATSADQTTPASTPRRPDRDADTVTRHTRHTRDDWRGMARRAQREGYGVAELVGVLVAAYAAGELDAPATRPPASQPTTHHDTSGAHP